MTRRLFASLLSLLLIIGSTGAFPQSRQREGRLPGPTGAVGTQPVNQAWLGALEPDLPVLSSRATRGWNAEIARVLASTTQVTAGYGHTCALTARGGVMCWGNNYGPTPVYVSGLTSGVSAVVAGDAHTCVLMTGGGVKCWGWNAQGQLGDGTTTDRSTPGDVSGLTSGVAAVSAGGFHTCALTTAGSVKCWGSNYDGELGDGTRIDRHAPVDVSGITSGAVTVVAGGNHTCALTTAGEVAYGVKCWGENTVGQLGDGTTTDRRTPVDVVGLTGNVSNLTLGYAHTCVLIASGGIKCWGNNFYGQLGDGTRINRSLPVDASELTGGVQAVATGLGHTCALTAAYGVKCWGDNSFGQLGDGTRSERYTLVDVSGLASDVNAVTASWDHTCALTAGGRIKCWGWNGYGQLGDGTKTGRSTPVDVSGLTSDATAAVVGRYHSCALTADGGVKCWGSNYNGQLGDGTTTDRWTPAIVSGLATGLTAVTAGEAHTCALTVDGGVKCWGGNSYGQLGDGTTTDRWTPVDVLGLTGRVVAVTAGDSHTCALTSDGGVKCWGGNYCGQLGDETSDDRYVPVDVNGLTSGVNAVTAGGGHTCVLTAAGGIKCWGANKYGELGDGSWFNGYSPADVRGLTSGAVAVAAGYIHTCALTTAGGGAYSVKCWGSNSYGQLGDGTTDERRTPVDVIALATGVSSVTTGYRHTCAVTSAGGIKCWGGNYEGELGDGTWIDRYTPVDVSGLTGGVSSVAAGGFHTCALTDGDGGADGVKCWGNNDQGQIGVDPGWTPVDVVGLEVKTPVFLPVILAGPVSQGL